MTDTIQYQLTRSKRKSVVIYVHRGGAVEVKAPNRMPRYLIDEFVWEKQTWILKKQKEWETLPAPMTPEYQEGSTHFFLGEPHQLVFGKSDDPAPVIELSLRSKLPENVANALERWYRKKSLEVFTERHSYWIDELKDLIDADSTIAVRKMTRRWGSCSRKGLITLNTHLVKYPITCIDAVIVHELCHLLEFNHSKRFYQLMDAAYPDWKPADKLLKDLSYQY